MSTWKRFKQDLDKYLNYAVFSARSDLKAEVASSYLNWLWWILDPLMFMLVYTFIAIIVFRSQVEYFPVFVFIGLTLWNYFNRTVQVCVKLIRNNSQIVTKVYIPKYILALQKLFELAFKTMISMSLVVILMIAYRVPVSLNVLYIIPIFVIVTLFTFGISCLVMHFGVFVDDLYNIMQIVLRLMFYMSGIFYSIKDRVPEPYKTILLDLNPMAMLIESARRCLLYRQGPYLKLMLIWGLVSVFLCILGIRVVYKYENSYVKVM